MRLAGHSVGGAGQATTTAFGKESVEPGFIGNGAPPSGPVRIAGRDFARLMARPGPLHRTVDVRVRVCQSVRVQEQAAPPQPSGKQRVQVS